ncbi:sugar kinase [Escherichia coli]
MSKKIAVIGECMIELSEKGADVKRGFGGDTLNTSVYIARQVDPAALTVHYVTALGTDSFSQQMLDAWHGENVDTSLTQRMENRLPGLYYIETDSTGERTFYYWRNEAAAKFWLESEQSAAICEELANFDYLYLSGISLAILSPTSREKLLSLLRECRANGGKVIFDNNYRPRLWASKEETQPVEDVIARTHNAGVKEVVVKRGADSCLVSIAGEGLVDVPAVKLPKEKVIDTTAAGDSFSAGYLAVRLTGGSAENAAKRGHLTASTVIQYRGAIIPREAMPA